MNSKTRFVMLSLTLGLLFVSAVSMGQGSEAFDDELRRIFEARNTTPKPSAPPVGSTMESPTRR